MDSKKIYLIRHGETEFNRKCIVQGSGVDAPLNETGFSQAQAFYKVYKDIPFDKVYTSILKRSIQSVGQFLKSGIPHTPLKALNEIHWGEKEGIIATDNDHKYYRHVTNQWRNGETHIPIEGGESPEQVMDRQKPALEQIISQKSEKLVLICMHGRAMKILLCLMLGYRLNQMDEFDHANLCLYKINYTKNEFSLESRNDTSHLNGL
jgi:2,3-bisphosphoglycerate-dependent phosphoglycerate mutase